VPYTQYCSPLSKLARKGCEFNMHTMAMHPQKRLASVKRLGKCFINLKICPFENMKIRIL
jgi:hypothetical protein